MSKKTIVIISLVAAVIIVAVGAFVLPGLIDKDDTSQNDNSPQIITITDDEKVYIWLISKVYNGQDTENAANFTYDDNGNMLSVNRHFGNVEYEYDENGNCITEKIDGYTSYTYVYNDEGLLTEKNASLHRYNFEYNDKNECIAMVGYDMKTNTQKSRTAYEYSGTGELMKATTDNGYVYEYIYDDKGVCVEKKQYFNGNLRETYILTNNYEESKGELRIIRSDGTEINYVIEYTKYELPYPKAEKVSDFQSRYIADYIMV